MGIVRSTVYVGQKIPKEAIREIRKAARYPIHYTDDCPKSTPEALKEFAQLAVERDRRKKKKSIRIRIALDVLESYKKMGDGYIDIMADVLKYAINNPSILTEATR
jgi:uncharacterized protein (DUF4415 family)